MTALRPPPSWRFVVTDLDGATITLLDHLASERVVTPMLGGPLFVTGEVPSDNPEINLLHTDGFPFLAEGVRQLYCFREENDVVPYFTVRASTLIQQVGDAAKEDDATSRFTAWDPWQYLMSVPVLQSPLGTVNGVAGEYGELIPSDPLIYPSTMTADEIVVDILDVMWGSVSPAAPLASQRGFLDWGWSGSALYSGTIETCVAFSDGWPITQGTMIGQALKDLMATGVIDILLLPIYDVANRPGILCEVNLYSQDLGAGTLGAGSYNYAAQFAWDRPGRTLIGADDMFDGTNRANKVQFYSGQGGPPVARQSDQDLVELYGEYWAQQFFPATPENLPAVVTLAALQLDLRSRYRQTLTVNPAPVMAPEPFTDYYLGDAVPMLISNRMRQALPPETLAQANALNSATVNVVSTNQWPGSGTFLIAGHAVTYSGKTATSFLGCSAHAATASGDIITTTTWQRVYGLPVSIDDNGTETVRSLIVGTVGAPP